jgi:hypothetical protein
VLPLLAACGTAPEREIGVFPVGDPIGDVVEVTIGTDGGTLATADGALTVTVPAGAVAADTTFSVQEITRTVPHGEGLAGFQDDEGHWVPVIDSTLDVDADTLTARTDHFSDWSVLDAYKLVAPASTVRTGRSLDLEVQSCLFRDEWDEQEQMVLPALARTCAAFGLPALIKAPSVNGIAGGNASVGTVERKGATLTYTAPGHVPSPDVVAVSAEISLLSKTKLLVVSELRVVDDVAFQGTCSMDDGAGSTVSEATVTWTESEDHDGVITYVPSGEVTYHLPDEGCTVTPATHAIAADDGFLEVDWSLSPPVYYGGGATAWQALMDCGEQNRVEIQVIAQWLAIPTPATASADGKDLEGSEAYFTWSFHAAE